MKFLPPGERLPVTHNGKISTRVWRKTICCCLLPSYGQWHTRYDYSVRQLCVCFYHYPGQHGSRRRACVSWFWSWFWVEGFETVLKRHITQTGCLGHLDSRTDWFCLCGFSVVGSQLNTLCSSKTQTNKLPLVVPTDRLFCCVYIHNLPDNEHIRYSTLGGGSDNVRAYKHK